MRILITLVFFLMVNYLQSQNLDRHQWNDRILLVLTTHAELPDYQQQLAEWEAHREGLVERKLVIYHLLPDRYELALPEQGIQNGKWKKGDQLYRQFSEPDEDFKVVLIGLDGTVKLQHEEVLTARELFATIDAMPMRRSEMRNKKN